MPANRKSSVAKRSPGPIGRYLDLIRRRKVRSLLVLCRLRKHISAAEFSSACKEELECAFALAATFFALGLVAGAAAALLAWR
jgi:hypothetical protein